MSALEETILQNIQLRKDIGEGKEERRGGHVCFDENFLAEFLGNEVERYAVSPLTYQILVSFVDVCEREYVFVCGKLFKHLFQEENRALKAKVRETFEKST